ncbi:CPBP family intramembrane glutamic endopeptidase [Rhodohalobacter mucosus]|nr:type II CAAX endopeptidase family protein [Rhodohalobacter mucosus]
MKILFYNNHENRLRAAWRILIFSVLLLSGMLLFSVLTSGSSAFSIFMALFIVPLIWFAAKKLDKRSIRNYGLSLSGSWVRDFAAGNIMAAASMTFLFLISLTMDWVRIDAFQFHFDIQFISGLLYLLLLMTAVSVWEEIYFRGFLITNLKEGLYLRSWGNRGAVLLAVLISSVFFGLMHSWNPNADWASTLNISIAGLVFAYPYIVTNSIAIPIGMHLSWNFFQGAVFGLPVSGTTFEHILMTVDVTGPEVFTGGQFGPEAGAAGLIGLMMLLICNRVYLSRFVHRG